MQLWVPEQYGGPNGNLTLACIAREEISKISPACASIAALNTMFIMPLLHFGSEEQRTQVPTDHRQGRHRDRDRDLRAAGRLRRHCHQHSRQNATATATSSTGASNGAATASSPTTSS